MEERTIDSIVVKTLQTLITTAESRRTQLMMDNTSEKKLIALDNVILEATGQLAGFYHLQDTDVTALEDRILELEDELEALQRAEPDERVRTLRDEVDQAEHDKRMLHKIIESQREEIRTLEQINLSHGRDKDRLAARLEEVSKGAQ